MQALVGFGMIIQPQRRFALPPRRKDKVALTPSHVRQFPGTVRQWPGGAGIAEPQGALGVEGIDQTFRLCQCDCATNRRSDRRNADSDAYATPHAASPSPSQYRLTAS